ncbi:B-cell receptor CD22-like, partial [Clarias magur]
MISGALGSEWSVTYSQNNLCALKGSAVFMNGSYTHPTRLTVTETFWLINPVQGKQETDLRNEPGYSGRVEYLGDEQKHFSLRLSDAKETDENRYYFRIRTSEEQWLNESGVSLTVTDLQLIAPAEVTEGQSAVLTCKTTCNLTDPTFIWYKNRRDLTTNTIKSNEVHLQPVSSEDAGSYSCAVRGYEHLPSPAQTLRVRYPPKNASVSVSPSDEIEEGSSVTLTCNSDANPPVKYYEWYKRTTLVGKGKTYTISKFRSEDIGEYKCKCRNAVRHQYSNGVTLNILYPPKNVSVSISPSGEIVEDSSVTLTCSSDANPPVENYTWFKVNESSAVGSGQSYRALQSGQYYCQAQNKHGSDRSAAVSVTLNGGSVIVYVCVGVGLFGLAALLPALFWLRCKRKKKKADEGDYQNIGLNAKDNAAPDLANQTSKYVFQTSLNSLPSPPDMSAFSDYENVTLDAASGPSMTQPSQSDYPPKNVSVAMHPSGEDNLVTLTCSSDSNPPVEIYTWFKVNESSAVGSGQSYRALQSGQYYCQAQNKHGSERSAAVFITLNAGGSVIAYVFAGVGLFGLAVLLSALFWLRYKRQKKQNDNDVYQNAGPSAKDDTYAALDPTGRETSDDVYQTLETSHPSPDADTSEYYNLAVITPTKVTEGQSVIMTCNTTCSLTDPTFIWYKNSRDLTTNTTKSNEVHLQPVSSEDAGSYSCAVGGYEHLPSPAQTLRVRYPPKNVSVSISPSGEIVEDSSVTLTCSSDANPPVEIYTWFKVNESSAVGSGQSYRALQSGQYYCQAQNKHGSERSAAVPVTINSGSVIVYMFIGGGLFGLTALLSALFWLRWKRQRKKAGEGDYQNAGSSAKDDTYAALNSAGRTSDALYYTLA